MMLSLEIFTFLVGFLLPWCNAVRPALDVVQFKEPPGGYENQRISIPKPGEVIPFYGGWQNMRIIILNNPEDVTFRIDLSIKPLDKNYSLTRCELCDGKETCESYTSLKNSSSVKWAVNFDKFKGANITLNVSLKEKITRNLIFYAKLASEVSAVRTQNFYIFDNRQNFNFESIDNVTVPASISANNPSEFRCRRVSKILLQYLHYQWFVGEGDEKRNAKDLSEIGRQLNWPVQILSDGSLYWPYVSKEALSELQGKRIFCKIQGNLAAQSTVNLDIKEDGASDKAVTDMEVHLYPAEDSPVLVTRNQPARYRCIFKVGRGSYKVVFSDDLKDFKEGQNNDGAILVNGTELVLHEWRSTKDIFRLKCNVTWTKKNGEIVAVKGKMNYKIYLLPKFAATLPLYDYGVEGGGFKVDCGQEGSPFTFNIAINGVELLKASKQEEKSSAVTTLSTTWKRPIFGTLTPDKLEPGKTVIFNAQKMALKSNSSLSSAYTLQCIGEGKPLAGSLKGLVTFRTIIVSTISKPKVKLLSKPNLTCGRAVNYDISPNLNRRIKYDGIQVIINWLKGVGSVRSNVDNIPPYFKKQSNGALNIKIPDSADKLKDLGFVSSINGTEWESSWNISYTFQMKNAIGRELISERSNDISILVKCPQSEPLDWTSIIIIAVVVALLLIVVVVIVVYIKCFRGVRVIRKQEQVDGSAEEEEKLNVDEMKL